MLTYFFFLCRIKAIIIDKTKERENQTYKDIDVKKNKGSSKCTIFGVSTKQKSEGR